MPQPLPARLTVRDRSSSSLSRAALWLLSVLVVLLGLGPAHADPIVEVGFESPDFTTGPIGGQAGWGGTAGVRVQSTTVLAGSQALEFDLASEGGSQNASVGVSFNPSIEVSPVVRVRAYFRFESLPSAQFSCFGFAGNAGFLGQVVAGEPFRLGSGRGTIDPGQFLRVGEWQLIETEIDFRSRRFAVWVDGQAAANGGLEGTSTSLSTVRIAAFAGAQDLTVQVDQFAVHAQPPSVARDAFDTPRFTQGPLNGQQGWSGSTSVAVQQAVKSTGDQALALDVTPSAPFRGISRSLSFDPATAPSPVFRAGIDFRASVTSTSQVTIMNLGTSDNLLQQISAIGGGFVLGGRSDSTSIDHPFVADRWYRIELEVDFSSKRVDAYIDGRYVVSREFVGDELGGLNIGAFGGATFTAYWDNFSVTSEPARILDTGFEVPPFTTGSVHQQQGWFATDATVDSTAARTSGHGVRVVGGESSSANVTTNIFVDSTTAASDGIEVRASFRPVSPLGGAIAFLSLFDSAQSNFAQFSVVPGGGVFALGDGGFIAADEIAMDEWYDLAIQIDFAAKRLRYFIDGRLVESLPLTASVSNLDRVDFFAFAAAGTTEFHVDDVSIRPLEYPPAPDILTSTLPEWTRDIPYGGQNGVQFQATGFGTLAWENTLDFLPSGMALDSSGNLSGTPANVGLFGFEATVLDAYGQRDAAFLFFDVNAPPSFAAEGLPFGAVGRDFTGRSRPTAGTPPLLIEVIGDPLPSGLSIDGESGVVTGRPTAGFTGPLDLRITDAVGAQHTASLDFGVASPFELRRGRARERLSLDEGEPRTGARYLELVRGTLVDIDLSGRFGDAIPELLLLGPDGRVVFESGESSATSRRVRVRKIPITQTGRHFLTWSIPPEVERSVRLGVRLKAPRKYAGGVSVDAGPSPRDFTFDALPGSKLTISVKGRDGVVPEILAILDENEVDLVPLGQLQNKRSARFKMTLPETVSRFTLRIDGANDVAGSLDYKVKLRAPREYLLDLSDIAAGDSLE